MFELDEVKECVNTIKKNLDVVLEKVIVTIQENAQNVEKNKEDISEIFRRFNTLVENGNVSEGNTEISDNKEVDYGKASDIINPKVELSDVEISLYKDAVGIKTPIDNKVFDIKDFDLYTKTGKEKEVLENFKIFVKSGGCVSEDIFRLKYKYLTKVKTGLGHFNTNIKSVFNIRRKGSACKRIEGVYTLKFKVQDKMDVEFFKKSP